jgi:hypothetical protein
MGLAMVIGWTIVIGGTVLAALLWVVVLRLLAAWGNAAVHPLWIAAAAAVAGAATMSVVFRVQGFRVATTHETPLPYMLGSALVAALILAFALSRQTADGARPGHGAILHGLCTVLIAGPPLVWALAVPLPAYRETLRNRVRSDYDEALSERDAARARSLLERNPWLAEEIEHAFDGMVPADESPREEDSMSGDDRAAPVERR